jgi:hypothetical protein
MHTLATGIGTRNIYIHLKPSCNLRDKCCKSKSNLLCHHHQHHRLYTTPNSLIYFHITVLAVSSRLSIAKRAGNIELFEGVCILLFLWLTDRSVTEGFHPPRITRLHPSFQVQRSETEFTETSVSCFSHRRRPRIAKHIKLNKNQLDAPLF